MKRASETVPAIAAEKNVDIPSKRQLRRVERFEIVNEQRNSGKQELAFNSRPFLLCGLPVRRPPAGVRDYARTNGQYWLEITGHREYGLPFGQDRLILVWLVTLAIRQQSPVIRFRSAAELLKAFGLPLDGKTYRRVVQGFQRIATSKITFRTDDSNGPARPWEIENLNFVSRARLWFPLNVRQETLPDDDFDNVIAISEEFWREIQNHKIPIELAVIRALADSPANLDLYCWIVWRCWTARHSPAGIPILISLESLKGQLGVSETLRIRRFRQQMRDWLKKIGQIWPECPARLSEDGNNLELEPGRAIVDRPVRQLP